MIFWTREKLNDHQLSRHSESVTDTYLLCGHCFAAFNDLVCEPFDYYERKPNHGQYFSILQPTLRSHNSTRHFDQRQHQCSGTRTAFQCNICRIALFSLREIRMHMKETHPELQLMFCAKANCGQIIENEEQLKCHWDDEHSKYTYQCLKCFKRFENEHFIENHLQNAHRGKIRKTEKVEDQSNESL